MENKKTEINLFEPDEITMSYFLVHMLIRSFKSSVYLPLPLIFANKVLSITFVKHVIPLLLSSNASVISAPGNCFFTDNIDGTIALEAGDVKGLDQVNFAEVGQYRINIENI